MKQRRHITLSTTFTTLDPVDEQHLRARLDAIIKDAVLAFLKPTNIGDSHETGSKITRTAVYRTNKVLTEGSGQK